MRRLFIDFFRDTFREASGLEGRLHEVLPHFVPFPSIDSIQLRIDLRPQIPAISTLLLTLHINAGEWNIRVYTQVEDISRSL